MRRLLLLAVWLAVVFPAIAQTRFTQYYNSVADLKAATPNPISAVAVVKYFAAPDSIDAGDVYYYSQASVAVDDGITVITPNNGIGRWLRSISSSGSTGSGVAWINVKDPAYGAKGDFNETTGIGTDDTDAIQAALNAVDTNVFATVIYFPRGSYKLLKTLYPKTGASRLMLLGDGKAGSDSVSQLRMIDPNQTMFDCSTNAINVLSIRGLQFQGPGKGLGSGHGVILGNSTTTMFDSVIQDCWFVGIPDTCILGTRMADYQIINNGIEGSSQGVVIDNTSVTGTYVDFVAINNISGNTFYSLNTAVRLGFVYGSRVNNNVFNFCGTDTQTNAAVVIERLGTNVESRNNLIEGNVFDRNWNDIYLHGDGSPGAHTGVNGVLISGNSSDFANRSFAVVDGANECIFNGNKINDCSALAITYPAFYVTGTTVRPAFFGNVVTKNGSFGPTYGLFCDTNVSQINIGHNRWYGNTADVRIEGTTEANGDVQSSAVAISIGSPFGTADLPMGYQWGIYGTNGFVAGAAGNIKVTGTGKQAIFGYDFTLDAGILRAADQGVAYKKLNIDGNPLLFNQNSGAYADFQTLRAKNSTAPTTGNGLEIGFNTTTTNGTITAFNRDASLYQTISLDGSAITLQPHSTAANVGIGVPIGTTPSERLQITPGNIALDNNQFLKLKDTAGTSENVVGIDNANNAQFNSPTLGGGHRYLLRKGDQTAKWQFGSGLVSPLTLSSNLVQITAALTATNGILVSGGGITNNGDGTLPGQLYLSETNKTNSIIIQGRNQLNATITNSWPGTNVSGVLNNNGSGDLSWLSINGSGPLVGSSGALLTNIVVRAQTNADLSASQTVVTDGNSKLSTVAYTGSGNFMRTRVGVVRSIDLPMGAWFTNGIATPATPASWTNTSDSFQFADAVTNTLRIRFPLPLNWDAGVVRAQFVMGNTLTNGTTSTNVVFGIKGATILSGGTEDALTFGTQVTVTNHVHRSPYVSTVCTTSDITVGNSPAANKDIVWELTRMTSDSTDVNTNTVSVLNVQMFYTESATEGSMPASTN